VLVAAGATFFFVNALWRNADVLGALTWDVWAWGCMLGSVLLLSVATLLGGGIWALILSSTGARLPLRQAVAIVAVSQFAKYMPGNVAHHVGRVLLAKSAGLSVPVVLQSMVFETLWALASAALVCVLAMLWLTCEGSCFHNALPIPMSGLLGLVVLLTLGPSVMVGLLARWWPVLLGRLGLGASQGRPRWPTVMAVQLLYGLAFVLAGVVLYWQSYVLFNAPAMNLGLAAGAFAAAWVAGYLVVGAPAGIGVREAALLVLLAPAMGEPAAASLGLSLRISSTASDLLVLLVGWALRRIQARAA
jgi:glycosyltransferase 2 family protein